jgi:hypothetical protein
MTSMNILLALMQISFFLAGRRKFQKRTDKLEKLKLFDLMVGYGGIEKRGRHHYLTPYFHYWRPHGESNPGYRRERPVS